MLTVPDVIEQLKVSRQTVLSWIKAGLLQASDVSPAKSKRKHYRIAPEELARFLTERGKSDTMSNMPVATKRYIRRDAA